MLTSPDEQLELNLQTKKQEVLEFIEGKTQRTLLFTVGVPPKAPDEVAQTKEARREASAKAAAQLQADVAQANVIAGPADAINAVNVPLGKLEEGSGQLLDVLASKLRDLPASSQYELLRDLKGVRKRLDEALGHVRDSIARLEKVAGRELAAIRNGAPVAASPLALPAQAEAGAEEIPTKPERVPAAALLTQPISIGPMGEPRGISVGRLAPGTLTPAWLQPGARVQIHCPGAYGHLGTLHGKLATLNWAKLDRDSSILIDGPTPQSNQCILTKYLRPAPAVEAEAVPPAPNGGEDDADEEVDFSALL
ncbi:hypothetical protein DB346_08585 [Verrucomicrobia bacterium LW23]|nr:hypothetical protein DB346_08585 [Verrucomicrobia bacterium LW23]